MSPQSAIQFLIGLVVAALVVYCVWLLLGMFALPQPIATVVMVILFLIVLCWLLNWAGLWRAPPP